MGLIVDIPKQGSGTTNDGNTARRFFQNSGVVSIITDIDENVIKRFGIILKIISLSTHETAKLYVQLYNWYPMPTSMHKLLVHGATIVSTAILPIGLFYVKYIREYNIRKCSRVATNENLFGKLLISLDPLITSLRHKPPRKTGIISREIIELLLEPEFCSYNSEILSKSLEESLEEE
ncbi:hypothetical protein ACFW04_006582 [Cataglyphis niger]